MYKYIVTAFIFFIASCGPATIDVEPLRFAERKQIDKLVNDYKLALKSADGESAISYLTTRTINYFDNYVKWANESSIKELKRLSIADEIVTRKLRLYVPPKLLVDMNGRDAIVYCVENRIIEKLGSLKISIINVEEYTPSEYMHGMVIGRVFEEGSDAVDFINLLKEDSIWKLDLIYLFNHYIGRFELLNQFGHSIKRRDYVAAMVANTG